MFGLGFSEILFLAILALVVIGPKQLPEVARTLGRFLNELRRTTSVLTDDIKSQMKFDPLDLNKTPQSAQKPAEPESPDAESQQKQKFSFSLASENVEMPLESEKKDPS